MFLRSITIRGFKSFADKTVLEFIPGVSVIVGPNGSGKSNLVDAISWVLGEQGARSLRGGNMADVIFAGTPSRPALGMAEVKLVIDNSAGQDPGADERDRGRAHDLPLGRIRVPHQRPGRATARRAGAADARRASAAPCTPSWARASSRRCSTPSPRIAAGTSRKPPASRSIAAARNGPSASSPNLDHDLLRLGDVVSELRRQLKPLQQQAEMASKHETLTAEAESLSRTLAAARLRALLREKERRAEGWQRGLDERSARPRAARCARRRRARRGRCPSAGVDGAGRRRARRSAARPRIGAGPSRRSAKPWSTRAPPGSSWRRRPRGPRASTPSTTRSRASRATSRASPASSRRASASSRRPNAAFREAEQERHRIEELRRRAGEDAAGRRAEVDALERSVASSERERERLASSLAAVRERIAETEAERAGLEAEIETFDDQSAPDEREALGARGRASDAGRQDRGARRRAPPARVSSRPARGSSPGHRGDRRVALPRGAHGARRRAC